MQLKVHLLSPSAKLPTKGTKLSAGYDLFASEHVTVPPQGRVIVPTGISIELPSGTYGRVAPRSGLAVKHGIDIGAGVIDEDYRGPVGVVLFNLGTSEFVVNPGDRVAQLIVTPYASPDIVQVATSTATDRGSGGFGSTGR